MADNVLHTPTGRISKAQSRSDLLFGKGNGALPPAIRSKKVSLSLQEFTRMMQLLPSLADKAFLQYTIALSQRAVVLFSRSFKNKRFYTSNSKPWEPITDNTWKTRQAHSKKYGRKCAPRDQILTEFGYLRKSLRIKTPLANAVGLYKRTVWTDPEDFNSPVHRRFVYAGIHNNPDPGDTYGTKFGAKKVVQRQFMGHSSYMDTFIDRYASRYLFDSIFNKPII